jgi:hypothetical protein
MAANARTRTFLHLFGNVTGSRLKNLVLHRSQLYLLARALTEPSDGPSGSSTPFRRDCTLEAQLKTEHAVAAVAEYLGR